MAAKPSFSMLWTVYDTGHHACSLTMDNQCAIRMSRALIRAGWSKDVFKSASYPGNLCPHGYARGAQDLAAFLAKTIGPRTHGWAAPGSVPAAAAGVSGIVAFMNIPGYGGQGHIDLWNGSETKTGAYWNSETIWFWKL